MNYIHALQVKVEKLEAEKREAKEAAHEILIYLASSKFSAPEDRWVNVDDIRARLEPVISPLRG